MSQVSRHELSNGVEQNINNVLYYFFGSLKNKSEAKDVLEEFFTPTEVEMLSKRLALIGMISQEKSFSEIIRRLKVSPSTVGRFTKVVDRGGYEGVRSMILRCRADF